jgi:ubiquinone/menaquinone biosynthesis C-methylase UbiE
MELTDYHLEELHIATSPAHVQHIMPPVLSSDRTVLDVGCGAGQTLIASTFEPGTTVVGVDCDRSALKLGRQLDDSICFVCGKGENLPFTTECFDFVFSRVALPYMHVSHTLSEIRRVLKPGGRVWLVLHPPSIVLREMRDALSQWKIKRAIVCLYVISNGIVLNSLGKEFQLPFKRHYHESFQTAGGIKRLLQNAGFRDIQTERTRFFVATARKF